VKITQTEQITFRREAVAADSPVFHLSKESCIWFSNFYQFPQSTTD